MRYLLDPTSGAGYACPIGSNHLSSSVNVNFGQRPNHQSRLVVG